LDQYGHPSYEYLGKKAKDARRGGSTRLPLLVAAQGAYNSRHSPRWPRGSGQQSSGDRQEDGEDRPACGVSPTDQGKETELAVLYLIGTLPQGKIGVGWRMVQDAMGERGSLESALMLMELDGGRRR